MKTPDEIKKGLEVCSNDTMLCYEKCPYFSSISNGVDCAVEMKADALAYIQQLEAKVPRWISVEERLPVEPCAVLVVMFGNSVCVAWYNIGGFETGSGLHFSAGNGVTHWMPLPSTEGLNDN